jgi:SAM-dependent methyltransferase
VYSPPCDPASFDLAYANAVLSHLKDPEACLQSMLTVLKPGGLVAIRDRGDESLVTGNGWEATKRLNSLVLEVIDATSGNPYGSRIGEVMNRLCREAGFEVMSITATWQITTARQLAAMGGGHPMGGPLGQRAVQLGVTIQQELDDLLPTLTQVWANDPDGFTAIPWFEVVARKP